MVLATVFASLVIWWNITQKLTNLSQVNLSMQGSEMAGIQRGLFHRHLGFCANASLVHNECHNLRPRWEGLGACPVHKVKQSKKIIKGNVIRKVLRYFRIKATHC